VLMKTSVCVQASRGVRSCIYAAGRLDVCVRVHWNLCKSILEFPKCVCCLVIFFYVLVIVNCKSWDTCIATVDLFALSCGAYGTKCGLTPRHMLKSLEGMHVRDGSILCGGTFILCSENFVLTFHRCLFAHQSSGQGLMVVSWHYRYRTLKCKTHTAIEGLAGSPSAEQRLCGSTAKAIFLPNSLLPEQPIILFHKFLMFSCSCLFYFSVPVTYVQALTMSRYVRDLAMFETCLSAASLPTNVCDSRQTVICDVTLCGVIDIY
jgi:hypothetical protein